MIKFSVIIALIFFCWCCKNTQPATDRENSSRKGEDTIPAVIIAPLEDMDPGDPFSIDSAWIKAHDLFIKVTFSGGCEEHDFELYSNRLYMKSLPPQVRVLLVHDGKGDVCRAIQKKMLKFDIQNLQSEEFNTLNIRIENYKNRVEYTY